MLDDQRVSGCRSTSCVGLWMSTARILGVVANPMGLITTVCPFISQLATPQVPISRPASDDPPRWTPVEPPGRCLSSWIGTAGTATHLPSWKRHRFLEKAGAYHFLYHDPWPCNQTWLAKESPIAVNECPCPFEWPLLRDFPGSHAWIPGSSGIYHDFFMGMLRGKGNMMIKHRILMASHTVPTKETQTWAPPEMQ